MSIQSKTFPASARSQIHASRAFLSVSLSNRLTIEETRLQEVLQWLQRSVSQFDVVIGDYFHRHNIEDIEKRQPFKALEIATEQGKAHAHRIQLALDHLGLTAVRIRCATDICAQADFVPALREMEAAWHSNTHFAQLIDQGTEAFLRRFAPERITVEPTRYHSRLYQLEELAMFTLLANEGYSTNVYAGAHLPVMKAFVSGGVDGVAPVLRSARLVELHPGRKK